MMNTVVRWLCLSGLGCQRYTFDRVWISFGPFHFRVDSQMEVDRILVGFWAA